MIDVNNTTQLTVKMLQDAIKGYSFNPEVIEEDKPIYEYAKQ